jgi:hypothetical protein
MKTNGSRWCGPGDQFLIYQVVLKAGNNKKMLALMLSENILTGYIVIRIQLTSFK